MAKGKKSEIHRRAKRLLEAFATEARRQTLISRQRKVIRATYEKGLLLLREDFVKLPDAYTPIDNSQSAFSYQKICKNQLPYQLNQSLKNTETNLELTAKEKLRKIVSDIVQMYGIYHGQRS